MSDTTEKDKSRSISTSAKSEEYHLASDVSFDKRDADVPADPSNDGIQPPTSRELKEGETPEEVNAKPAYKQENDPVRGKKAPVRLKPGKPRGGHHGSKPTRGGMKFGERPEAGTPDELDREGPRFNSSKYPRMTAVKFHKFNDLSRSARGVGYTPDQAVPKYGPGVTDEAEKLYGPCKLLTDFQYSTWTETVVPLRNHNVVQGFNEMILFLMKLADKPDEPPNHEEAFMATSFLANIRNDLGEHPPNVLALLEYIDYKTRNDGSERPYELTEVIPPCKASERY